MSELAKLSQEISKMAATKTVAATAGMQCPHCEKPVHIAVVVPDEQRISFRLEMKGEWCGAATFGHCLINLDKILKGSAKELGARVEVLLESVEQEPHRIQANLVLMEVVEKKKGRDMPDLNPAPK